MPLRPEDLPPHIRAQLPGANSSKRKRSTQTTQGGRWFCWRCAFSPHDHRPVHEREPKPAEVFTTWAAVERHQADTGHARYEQVMT